MGRDGCPQWRQFRKRMLLMPKHCFVCCGQASPLACQMEFSGRSFNLKSRSDNFIAASVPLFSGQ